MIAEGIEKLIYQEHERRRQCIKWIYNKRRNPRANQAL